MARLYNKRNNDAPCGSIYIGRGYGSEYRSLFGNPFCNSNRTVNCLNYLRWLRGEIEAPAGWVRPTVKQIQKHLAGQNLVCWCAPNLCHGLVLLSVANGKILISSPEWGGIEKDDFRLLLSCKAEIYDMVDGKLTRRTDLEEKRLKVRERLLK